MSERLDLSVKVFNAELQLMQLQKDLKARIEKATKENERKYFLHEQLKAIQKEMGGDKDPKQNYLNMVNAKLEQMRKDHVSPAAIAVELEKRVETRRWRRKCSACRSSTSSTRSSTRRRTTSTG